MQSINGWQTERPELFANPLDPAFAGDFAAELATFRQYYPGASVAQWDAAIAQALNEHIAKYGRGWGSGTNPYGAAHWAADKLAQILAATPAPYDVQRNTEQEAIAVARSPEGIARANDDDGFGDLIGFAVLGISAAFLGPQIFAALAPAEGAVISVGALEASAGIAELGLIATPATASAAVAAGIEAGVVGLGAAAAASAPAITVGAAEAIPELGLIATPATAEAAIAAGIPAEMLAANYVPAAFSLPSSPGISAPGGSGSGGSGSSASSGGTVSKLVQAAKASGLLGAIATGGGEANTGPIAAPVAPAPSWGALLLLGALGLAGASALSR